VLVVCRMAAQYLKSSASQLVLALAVIGATPLVPLVFTGMEHALHAALCLLFLWRAALALAAEGEEIGSIDWLLLAPAMTATRFEGMFAVAAVCLLLLLKRRVRHAVLLAVLGLLPIVAYAAFSVAQGSLPLPNSVLLKVPGPDLGSVGGLVAYSLLWLTRLAHNPQLLVLTVAACVFFVVSRPRATAWTAAQFMEAAFVMVTLLHLQFAQTGRFYRYEAYLVATGLVVTAIGASEVMSASGERWGGLSVVQRVGLTAGLACFAAPLLQRASESVARTPIAMANVHQQQYQMARFVHTYYDGQAVAANDIGAISFMADIELLDLFGVASVDVVRAKIAGRYDTGRIRELAALRGVRIAIVYDKWFTGRKALPPLWKHVGKWTIPDNVVCGDATVSFYAVDGAEAGKLSERLAEFSPSLPEPVMESGSYLKSRRP